MGWELILFVILLPTGLGYTIGRSRDRGGLGLILGLFLSWLGVVITLLLPTGGARCPSCAEHIKREAVVCKHCGAHFEIVSANPWKKDERRLLPAERPRANVAHQPPAPATVDRDTV